MMHYRIKRVRVQLPEHTMVDFVDGSMACSCGLTRGTPPNLRVKDIPGKEQA